MKYLPLILILTACQMEHEVEIPGVEVQPIEIYLCISGWLYDTDGDPVLNVAGGQETCSEGY